MASKSPAPRSRAWNGIAGCDQLALGGSGVCLKKGCAGDALAPADARRGQCVLDGVAHRLVHLAPVAKAHLDLGRVHVDVDARGVDLQVQHVHRLALAVQHVFVGAAHRVRQHLVAHEAAVDVEELLVVARARRVGNAGTADHAHRAAFAQHGDALRHEVVAQRIGQPLLGRGGGAPLFDQLAVVPDREAHLGPRQRMAAHGLDAVGQLGGVGLQELAPRGRGKEQLAHLDRGAHRTRHRP